MWFSTRRIEDEEVPQQHAEARLAQHRALRAPAAARHLGGSGTQPARSQREGLPILQIQQEELLSSSACVSELASLRPHRYRHTTSGLQTTRTDKLLTSVLLELVIKNILKLLLL